jgi:hypothetical protein
MTIKVGVKMEKNSSEEVVKGWREELLGYLREMADFSNLNDSYIILRKISGFSARATYMNNLIGSSKNRQLTEFKFNEIVPFLKESEFQFKIWSRVASIHASEWEMTKG